MSLLIPLQISPREASDQEVYTAIAAARAGIDPSRIALARVVKRSVDARSRSPKVNLTVELFVDRESPMPPARVDYTSVAGRTEVIVVGAGPAGLFAALRLIELGYRPIVLERGKCVADRKRDVAQLNRNGPLDPDSNYAFGEGGAGTFSDGKLFTRSKKRGDYSRILHILHAHGAQDQILYDAHPHIGTDRLPGVITRIRETIENAGGRICFSKKATGFELHGGRIKAVRCGDEIFEGAAVVLATGHSARDIYRLLDASGIGVEAKPFAMGVRVEHPQALIDSAQYHCATRDPHLPAAEYRLVTQVGGRGVYSFCMCPGGIIVPAMTSADESVVNGMSSSGRNSAFANAGLVTEVRPEDFAFLQAQHGSLAGLVFQEMLEHTARREGGNAQIAPAQRLTDFVAARPSTTLPGMSYHPGAVPSQLYRWMPEFISTALRRGCSDFEGKLRGFLTREAAVLGVESRTSSPVRIPRDPQTLMHTSVKGLFPAAEGAGYAGGIVSAAMDGERVAEAVAAFLGGK